MGGLGVTSMVEVAPAARVGSWALCWRPLQRLCPRLFGEVDISASEAPSLVELRAVHAQLMEQWRRTQGVYGDWHHNVFDYDKEGESHLRFHPQHLPARHELLTVAEFAFESDYLQHAQRTWSRIVHHSAWIKLLARMRTVSVREAVRFISVSQPHAGDFLNAVPARAAFRINTWAMRIAVQRRLGLPLTAAAVSGEEGRSRHGHVFDLMGDMATNDGHAGCQTRHYVVLTELVRVLRTVWGSRVEYEPKGYRDYSDTRPDLTIQGAGAGGGLLLGDTKLFDSVGSKPSAVGLRGAYVSFGNTLPHARELVLGRAERGVPGTRFNPRTGAGHVAAIQGAYERAVEHGVEVQPLLFEVWGGWSPAVVELMEAAAAERRNKLTRAEYDQATWSTRSWSVFAAQRVACALVRAVAYAVARELELTTARDPRDD